MSTINIRVNEQVKSDAKKLFAKFGLDLSTAINMFLIQAIREQGVPLDLYLHTPNEETLKSIEDAEKGVNLSETFESIDELMEDLNA